MRPVLIVRTASSYWPRVQTARIDAHYSDRVRAERRDGRLWAKRRCCGRRRLSAAPACAGVQGVSSVKLVSAGSSRRQALEHARRVRCTTSICFLAECTVRTFRRTGSQIGDHDAVGGHKLVGLGYYEITGLALSGRGKVSASDVSVDGGAQLQTARLQEPVLTQGTDTIPFATGIGDGAPALLQSRAVDETGHVQPNIQQLRAVRGLRSIYHNNAVQTWRVQPDGEVWNVQVA